MIAEAPVETVAIEPEHAAALALVAERFGSDVWQKIDALEGELEQLPAEFLQPLALHHVFTPGLYVRECCMRKGQIVTTRIHLTEHPFIVSAGCVSVLNDDGTWQTIRAPYTGVTKPGTRRVIVVHEDTIWSTAHINPSNETDPDKIVREVTFNGGKYAELGIAAATPVLTEGESQ